MRKRSWYGSIPHITLLDRVTSGFTNGLRRLRLRRPAHLRTQYIRVPPTPDTPAGRNGDLKTNEAASIVLPPPLTLERVSNQIQQISESADITVSGFSKAYALLFIPTTDCRYAHQFLDTPLVQMVVHAFIHQISLETLSSNDDNDRSAVTPFRCVAAMPSEGSTKVETLPSCPSLDRNSRDVEAMDRPLKLPDFLGHPSVSSTIELLPQITLSYLMTAGQPFSFEWESEKNAANGGPYVMVHHFVEIRIRNFFTENPSLKFVDPLTFVILECDKAGRIVMCLVMFTLSYFIHFSFGYGTSINEIYASDVRWKVLLGRLYLAYYATSVGTSKCTFAPTPNGSRIGYNINAKPKIVKLLSVKHLTSLKRLRGMTLYEAAPSTVACKVTERPYGIASASSGRFQQVWSQVKSRLRFSNEQKKWTHLHHKNT
ncbi:hypothetical protein CLF_104969 [Clonorchis sinensis]|uniref:Uncharacterized protein n=1 Tax=Clonorchis sinensis TaxID=79923 RepID=G7YCQ1_CLOSI|nr:hypothetical protein CLF_104969 [Clonorchis sinensis]